MFTITVAPGFAAVRYAKGAFVAVLPAGRHTRRPGHTHRLVDVRERLLPLALQEIPSADGIAVRIAATLRVVIVDPRLFLEQAQDAFAMVYLVAQVALRESLAGLSAAELTARGAVLPIADVTAKVEASAARVGVAVVEVVIKDVVLPPELRMAAMELATAKHRAAILLEQARAETAALRSMANAAKMLDEHPALARLRLVQAAGPGARVVLQVGNGPAEASD